MTRVNHQCHKKAVQRIEGTKQHCDQNEFHAAGKDQRAGKKDTRAKSPCCRYKNRRKYLKKETLRKLAALVESSFECFAIFVVHN